MAAKTWSGDAWWRAGGGDVWDPITYDPATGLVIFGTAGAEPESLFGDNAELKVGGDRLFSGCVDGGEGGHRRVRVALPDQRRTFSHREHAHPDWRT